MTDNPIYKAMKKMECQSQSMLFEIPLPGSEQYQALEIEAGEAWKLGALIDCLIWFRDKSATAANRVFLEGKREVP